CVHDVRLPPTF
nr:immunoglobulin light chain junction region [Macaca mulatta]